MCQVEFLGSCFANLYLLASVSLCFSRCYKYILWGGEAWQQQVLITVPLRALLDQFAPDFPAFCKVGTGHNNKIDYVAKGFISVTKSVGFLQNVFFDAILVDEAHHPLPPGLPKCENMFQFSATLGDSTEFSYSMGQAIEDGILCDYDITVPAITAHHAYVCLADLLLKQAGRFRRVLAYCNSVAEARKFQIVLQELGLAAWHMNALTTHKKRKQIMDEFTGALRKPVHVLVTVEVLGEGINIPNADTCMFVEPRNSYRSIVQAIGRVLRHHPSKAIAHIVLPAVAAPSLGFQQASSTSSPVSRLAQQEPKAQHLVKDPLRSTARSLALAQMTSTQESPDRDVMHIEPGGERPESGLANAKPGHNQPSEASKSYLSNGKAQPGHKIGERMHLPRKSAASETQEMKVKPCGDLRRVSGANSVANGQDCQVQCNPQSSTAFQHQELDDLVYGQGQAMWRGGQVRPSGYPPLVPNSVCNQRKEEMDYAVGTRPTRLVEADSLGFNFSNDTGRRSDGTKKKDRQVAELISKPALFFGQEFSSQLERFLSTLMVADHRLVGTIAAHRIQVVDCRIGLEGVLGRDSLVEGTYEHLATILSHSDQWELKFRRLQDFVEEWGRLPRIYGTSAAERVLSHWFKNQGTLVRQGQLQSHQMQSLQAASATPIKQRVATWLSGENHATIFQQRCRELKDYVQKHKQIPKVALSARSADRESQRVAKWLGNNRQRSQQGLLSPNQRKALQEVHPLIAALLDRWDATPLQIVSRRWEVQLKKLTDFVLKHGDLPSANFKYRPLYRWLRDQLYRLSAGKLPAEFIAKLQDAHPLIAEAARYARTKSSGKGCWIAAPCSGIGVSCCHRTQPRDLICDYCLWLWLGFTKKTQQDF